MSPDSLYHDGAITVTNAGIQSVNFADNLGLSRKTVSHRLTDFQTDGLIDLPDIHTANIPKLDGLKQRAGAMV